MPRYKVRVKVEQDSQTGSVVVEAASPDEVEDAVDTLFQDDPDAFDWEPEDVSKLDFVDILEFKEDGSEVWLAPIREEPEPEPEPRKLDLRVKEALVKS